MESLPAELASALHAHSVHIHQVYPIREFRGYVYNLEVEEAHHYIANGILVHNCDDCPRWADAGPYTLATLPAMPGDGTSKCESSCLCRLQLHGGDAVGF
jgi:hypothetical protein